MKMIRCFEVLAATLVLAFAARSPAGEVWVNSRTRDVRWTGRPPAVMAPWGEYREAPSDEFLSRCDWAVYSFDCPPESAVVSFDGGVLVRCKTQEELDAEAAEIARAEAEAEAQASLPLMSASGFAAPNEAGHWVKFVAATTNEISETLAVQISHSPPDPVVAAQMERDAKAKWKAGKDAEAASAAKKLAAIESAGKNGRVNDRLDAIEAALKELLK